LARSFANEHYYRLLFAFSWNSLRTLLAEAALLAVLDLHVEIIEFAH
jgi:hypothetical protein